MAFKHHSASLGNVHLEMEGTQEQGYVEDGFIEATILSAMYSSLLLPQPELKGARRHK